MARIVLKPSNKEVECGFGETVLSALEHAGYALPNNCRAGACGECKVKVLAGEFDQGIVLDMALSQAEREQGYGLMCMAKPISDVMEIEWGTADAMPKLFPPREGVLCTVIEKNKIANRVVELHLRPVGQILRYWPGQNIKLGNEAENIPERQYSMANAPRPDGELVLQVSREEGGITSTWVHDKLKVGDSVKISGPYGTFIGDPSVDTPVLCLAAGTGLAPILSLAEAALKRGFRKPVNLIFSARTKEDVYGQGMMAWWRLKHRNFDYKITLTREEAEGFEHGRIDAQLSKWYPDLSKHSIFIAGSPAFVDACEEAAKRLGAQDSLIHTEGYYTSEELQKPEEDPFQFLKM
jgi:CDP-4-dehydro-6-deoxyglucose reductase